MAHVKALRLHTHAGKEHQEGETYEVPDGELDNLIGQGMAEVVERAKPVPHIATMKASALTKGHK